MDWGRLPGVTSAHMAAAFVKRVTQPESFVGGVTDGNYGAAAMRFNQLSTQGSKAWFLFDHEIVALGAGINSTRDEPVSTTLNQTLLRGPVLIDGKEFEGGEANVPPASWVLHDEWVTLSLRHGCSPESGAPNGRLEIHQPPVLDQPVTTPVFSLWIDHGIHPHGAAYAYVVLPDTNAQQTADWVAHPRARILANTSAQQAVVNDQLGVAEMVFHSPGSITISQGFEVKTDRPCLVLMVRQGDRHALPLQVPAESLRPYT